MGSPAIVEASCAPMSKKEAQSCAKKIRDGINNVGELVLDLHERRGWEALGYRSWRECVTAEFGRKENYLYKLLKHAEVERNLYNCTKEPAQLNEAQARELSKLKTPEEQAGVFEEVRAGGDMTPRRIAEAVAERRGRTGEPDPFHVLNAAGDLKDSVRAAVSKKLDPWPGDKRSLIPQLLRDLAAEYAEEFGDLPEGVRCS